MSVQILALLALAFAGLFAAAELLYYKAGLPAEITRKIVHAGTGLLTLLFPVVLTYLWQVVVLCVGFFLLLLCSLRWRWLRSINGVQRDTVGSLLYPVIVIILFYTYQAAQAASLALPPQTFFYLPLLIMALCDPLAALVGQSAAHKAPARVGCKTFRGSLAFFAGAFVLTTACCYNRLSPDRAFLLAATIAIVTCLAERWSRRGWDNFFIPLAASLVLWGFESIP